MPNRLAAETSPLPAQHADNPVDWYPWGEEALARARDARTSRSCCRSATRRATGATSWRTSRSRTPAIAAAMNATSSTSRSTARSGPTSTRSTRRAHALLTRRAGGWPLTMFLTPDGAPFFAGTYFPKPSRYGMPGFLDLLQRVAAPIASTGAEIARAERRLVDALAALEPAAAATRDARRASRSTRAARSSTRRFDRVTAASAARPSFRMRRSSSSACAHARSRGDDERARRSCARSRSTRMADGGIHDQLGGGFCRYSVDAQWIDPALREDALRQRPRCSRSMRDACARDGEPRVRATSRTRSSAG